MRCSTASVVMPYFKNERTLLRSLNSICAQDCPELIEIVVVDDGGPVRAKTVIGEKQFALPVIVLESKNLGQSSATNRGILASRGDLTILTCADIILAPNFVRTHLEGHAKGSLPQGVCGFIQYAPWVRMTPFMHYLASPGPQFNFAVISNPEHVAPGLVYAPNFSAQRKELIDAGLFDDLLVYGFQDVDLGLRLAKRGVHLRYEKDAIALHDHPNNIERFFERQRRVGHMLPRFLDNNPHQQFIDSFTESFELARPALAYATDMVAQLKHLEDKVCSVRGAFEALRQPLFEVYSVVMMMGFIVGVLETGDKIRDMLPGNPEMFSKMVEAGQHFQESLSKKNVFEAKSQNISSAPSA